MVKIALSVSFEYLFHVSTAIINTYSFRAGIDFRRQIVTSKVNPRTERVKYDLNLFNRLEKKVSTCIIFSFICYRNSV